jgi:hypothetical protein
MADGDSAYLVGLIMPVNLKYGATVPLAGSSNSDAAASSHLHAIV